MFREVEKSTQESKKLKDEIHQLMAKKGLRPGANITVMGVGGAGRNAIRNMRSMGLGQLVKLVAIDTDAGSDKSRYPNRKRP
jgi:cell division GTPase FtsZ